MTQHVEKYVPIFKEAIKKAEQDPAWFYENILNFKPLKWQVEGTQAVFDVRRKAQKKKTVINHEGLPRISVRSCHGPGKTQWLAMLAHVWNFTTRGKIAATAPKEAQLTKRLFPRYRRAMRDADRAYKRAIRVLGKEIVCFDDPDWGLVAETASDPDNLSGYHDTPQLFLIDEASAKRLDSMFPVIEGALTTPGSVSVEIGNPTRLDGEFYNHHNKKGVRELYFKKHITQKDAPELVTKDWINNMIAKYGANSPITLIRAMGEFASFDEYILLQPDLIDDALDYDEMEDGSLPKLRVSIDVADGGADSTVVTVARHYESFIEVVKQKAFWFKASEAPIQAAKVAVEMFHSYGGKKGTHDDFVPDSIGVGAGTAGRLMELGMNVVPFKGGSSSDNPTLWRNKRVQSYMAMYSAFMNNKIHILCDAVDDEEELRAHLLSIKRRVSNDKVDDLMPKDTIKNDGLPSPDRADSLMQQFATESPEFVQNFFVPETFGSLESAGYDGGLT